MTTHFMSRAFRSLLLCGALAPALALAAGSAVLQTDGGKSEILWQNPQTVRMGAANADEYTLLKGDHIYAVSQEDGQARVMELSGMLKAMGGMAKKMAKNYPDFGKVTTINASGKSETVAGIKGEVYHITTKQADGSTDTQEVVLTDDARAVELTHAYIAAAQAIIGKMGVDKFMNALPAGKRGLLRSGDNFRLVSISADAPAASLFALPAKPQDLGKMMQGMGAQMQKAMQQMQQQMQQQQQR